MKRRERQLQYFWEVFPAQDGITTYMFAYTDPTPGTSRHANRLQHPPRHIIHLPDQLHAAHLMALVLQADPCLLRVSWVNCCIPHT